MCVYELDEGHIFLSFSTHVTFQPNIVSTTLKLRSNKVDKKVLM